MKQKCQMCAKEFTVRPQNSNQKSCSGVCRSKLFRSHKKAVAKSIPLAEYPLTTKKDVFDMSTLPDVTVLPAVYLKKAHDLWDALVSGDTTVRVA